MKALPILALLAIVFVSSTSFHKPFSSTSFYVVIDKGDYELNVYDEEGWLITYPVVFGNKDHGDKLMEGDRKTPDGTFHIASKRVHEKWCRFMALDYPTRESLLKFQERKAAGIIPANASIGGAIGIHGTWPHEEFAIDQYQNWTWGCISMKNEHVEQLYKMVPVGTRITIKE
ncbi:MAG: L,D-transpeptidase [Chitinophagaceae bacterium]|nr:L,D-transpeptidase [Chitinophagaceae bacterium]